MQLPLIIGLPVAFLGTNDLTGEPRVPIKSAVRLHRCHCGHPTTLYNMFQMHQETEH